MHKKNTKENKRKFKNRSIFKSLSLSGQWQQQTLEDSIKKRPIITHVTYIQVFAVLVRYTSIVTSQIFIHRDLQFVCTKRTLALFLSQQTVPTRAFTQWVAAHRFPAAVDFGQAESACCSENKTKQKQYDNVHSNRVIFNPEISLYLYTDARVKDATPSCS